MKSKKEKKEQKITETEKKGKLTGEKKQNKYIEVREREKSYLLFKVK